MKKLINYPQNSKGLTSINIAMTLSLVLITCSSSIFAQSNDDMLEVDLAFLSKSGFSLKPEDLKSWLSRKSKGSFTESEIAKALDDIKSPTIETRTRGIMTITSMGPTGKPALRNLENSSEGLIKALAKNCLDIMNSPSSRTETAVIRVLASNSPDLAIQGILEISPIIDDEIALDFARKTLFELTWAKSSPNQLILEALDSPSKTQRLLAWEMLIPAQKLLARDLFQSRIKDESPEVRFLIASTLARNLNALGFETLIELTAVLSDSKAQEAEDVLLDIVGDLAPQDIMKNKNTPKNNSVIWKKWWSELNGENLLLQFTKKIPNQEDQKKIKDLIRELGDDKFEVREKASSKIKGLGDLVVPTLRSLTNSTDVEIKGRAKALLEEMGESKSKPVSSSLVKILALKNTKGFLGALLAYLPVAESDEQFSDFLESAILYARKQPTASPEALELLDSENPRVKLASALLLLPFDDSNSKESVKKILGGKNPWIQSRLAMAMVGLADKSAMPVLIQSLADLTQEQASEADAFLFEIAGTNLPSDLPSSPSDRKKTKDAWLNWWNKNADKISLAKCLMGNLQTISNGNIIISSLANNQVFELDRNGKSRWTISGLSGPMDAQSLPNGRILITEHHNMKITERNTRGEILWTKTVTSNPLSSTRLKSGLTSITCRNMILEVDRTGKELLNIPRPQSDIMSAERLRDGTYLVATNQMTLLKIDRSGKESNIIRLPLGVASHANDILQDGTTILPLTWHNKLQEMDPSGKVILDITVTQPTAAVKLPNKNILVATQTNPPKLIELDRSGKQVSERQALHPVFRIRTR
jgi:HEAT repeat protein